MKLSIVIVNYKNSALLRLCLNSVYKSLLVKTDVEMIVVDISSSIETRNVAVEEFEDVKYLSFRDYMS